MNPRPPSPRCRNLINDWHEVANVTVGYSVWGVGPWLHVRAENAVDFGTRSVAVPDVDESEHLLLLMGRYQRADRAAAAELVRILSPKLLRYLAGPLYTRPYAEDMLQECWLRIHRAGIRIAPALRCCPGFLRSLDTPGSTPSAGGGESSPENRLWKNWENCPPPLQTCRVSWKATSGDSFASCRPASRK